MPYVSAAGAGSMSLEATLARDKALKPVQYDSNMDACRWLYFM
jgi:hypothetical protein